MKLKSVVLLAVAVACGLVAMLGVQQALSKKKEQPVVLAQVLVATSDIAPGTRLDETNTGFKKVPKELVPEGAVTEPDQYTDRALRGGAVAGEMIMIAKLGEKGVFGASGEIPKGMRVVTVPVNLTTTHSGLVRPGDRVDVMLTYKERVAEVGMVSRTRTVLEYIKVFATDSLIAGEQAGGGATEEIKAKNISLLVWPEQASDLMTAKSEGELHLALRHKNDNPLAEVEERPRLSQREREEIKDMMTGVLQWLGQAANALRGDETTHVLVATGAITPGSKLDESNTAFKEMPSKLVPKGAITKPDQFEERALLGGAVEGEMILASQLGEKGVFGASAQIPKGMRVITVPVDMTKTHSGRLQAGDKVDVLVTYEYEVADEPIKVEREASFAAPQAGDENEARIRGALSASTAAQSGSGQPQLARQSEKTEVPQKQKVSRTKTVAECIQVFATDGVLPEQNTAEAGEGGKPKIQSQHVSFLVEPEQANLLILAESLGTLHLSLRHQLDCSPTHVAAVDELEFHDAPVSIAQSCGGNAPAGPTHPVVDLASECLWPVTIRSGTSVRVQKFARPEEECEDAAPAGGPAI